MTLPQRLIDWMMDDTDDEPVLRPEDFHWEICDRCQGEGTLGGWPGAYTESDRAEWSYEDYEDYFNTRRCCEDCEGTGKVREINDDALERPSVRAYIDDYFDTENIYRMERMYGA
jgi:hypothetical protein